MKVTLEVDLPDHFSKLEVEYWKNNMVTMAGYHVREVIKNRGEGEAEETKKSVKFQVDQ